MLFRGSEDYIQDVFDPMFQDTEVEPTTLAETIKGGGQGLGSMTQQEVSVGYNMCLLFTEILILCLVLYCLILW